MDEKELRRQRIIAKAKLDELKMRQSHGEAVADAVVKQEAVLSDLLGYVIKHETDIHFLNGSKIKLPTASVKVSELPLGLSGRGDFAAIVNTNDAENTAEIESVWFDPNLVGLSEELAEIDNRKNAKINELQGLDRSKNHRALVQEIKSLRTEYINKNDEIYYYKRHGSLPDVVNTSDDEVGSEFTASLPRDKFELNKKKLSLRSSLSRFEGRLKKAKSETAKKTQLKNIAQANLKLGIIDQLMSSL